MSWQISCGFKNLDNLEVQMRKFKNTLLVGFFKNQSKSNIFTKEIPVNFTGNSFVNFTGISFVKLTSISIKWDFPYTWSEFWKNVFFWFWQKFRGISLWKNFVKGFPLFFWKKIKGTFLQKKITKGFPCIFESEFQGCFFFEKN